MKEASLENPNNLVCIEIFKSTQLRAVIFLLLPSWFAKSIILCQITVVAAEGGITRKSQYSLLENPNNLC